MPRYYFDVNDGEKSFVDDEGSDLSDANAAWDEVLAILPDYAQNVLPDGGNRDFASRVRDEAGNDILRLIFRVFDVPRQRSRIVVLVQLIHMQLRQGFLAGFFEGLVANSRVGCRSGLDDPSFTLR